MNEAKRLQAILMLAEELKCTKAEAEKLLNKMVNEYKQSHEQ